MIAFDIDSLNSKTKTKKYKSLHKQKYFPIWHFQCDAEYCVYGRFSLCGSRIVLQCRTIHTLYALCVTVPISKCAKSNWNDCCCCCFLLPCVMWMYIDFILPSSYQTQPYGSFQADILFYYRACHVQIAIANSALIHFSDITLLVYFYCSSLK